MNVRLFSEQDVDPDIRTRRGKKRLENTPHIRGTKLGLTLTLGKIKLKDFKIVHLEEFMK